MASLETKRASSPTSGSGAAWSREAMESARARCTEAEQTIAKAEKTIKAAKEPKTSRESKKRKADQITIVHRIDDTSFLDEHKCPITHNLPVDPVMAEDGRVYERDAIEEWFKTHKGVHCPSPMTMVTIGKNLVPAVQARNTIEQLIKKGLIAGEPAETWRRKTAAWDAFSPIMRDHYKRANNGDATSMHHIGFAYRDGSQGVTKDDAVAAEWFDKAALHGSATGGSALGVMYLEGQGVVRCSVRGHIELARAAMAGSEHAAICIARNMFAGHYMRFKGDTEQAKWWYQLSAKCKHQDSDDFARRERAEWLAKHYPPSWPATA